MKRLILVGLMAMSGTCLAASNLNAVEVKSLMIDKTIVGFNEIKSMDYTVYFHHEGKIVLATAKGKRQGNWRIAEDGHFCTAFPAEPELCTFLTAGDKGTYRRVKDDGTATHTLKSFTSGNVNNY